MAAIKVLWAWTVKQLPREGVICFNQLVCGRKEWIPFPVQQREITAARQVAEDGDRNDSL